MLSNFSKAKVNENKKISKNDKKILIYIGSLAEIRGIKEIICSMAEVDIETELWLIGRWENEQFRRECEALPEFKRVKYVGYINHNKIPSYLRLADVGLVTLHPTTTFIESYPIKVFEYMSSALPVIMSDFLLWKELFKDAAIFVDPLNVKDIANKIQYILSQDEIRKNIALKGENLVLTKYNWEMESKKLIHLYDLLLKSSD
jgi:glycosyltransferase involved in cell wall biosynthesis